MTTIWQNRPSNLAPRGNIAFTSVIRRAASGYVWRLMCQEQMVSTGTARTRDGCHKSIREEKARRAGL